MSEYLNDNPKKLVIKNGKNEIKNEQFFDHNENGDPIYYKKIQNGEIVVELEYSYEYDEIGRKLKTTINDLLTKNTTIMEYSY